MKPYEIANHLSSSNSPEDLLGSLKQDDHFWGSASLAIDPFVGVIVRLPLRRNPTEYGDGLDPKIFEKVVKLILDGELTGDRLAVSIELLSKSCQEDEWLFWYKPILKGEMDIPISLEIFNKFCPLEYQVPPPILNKPKAIVSMADLPRKFIIQPEYPFKYVFWFIDSMHQAIEIRCYDSDIRRVRDSRVAEILAEFARSKSLDIVLMGYMTEGSFIASDILSRDQFTRETGIASLENRLAVLDKFGIPIVQNSPVLTSQGDEFFKELNLIFEQGYKGAMIRDIDGNYPFRVQCDLAVSPTIKGIITCTEIVPSVGIRGESKRGEKMINSFTRLGLKESTWRSISEERIGQRFDVLSCGQKDTELLLPIFQSWKD